MTADDPIDRLSAAVCDGARVNWDGEESGAHATLAQQTIRGLRHLARIASFNRDLQSTVDETVASPVFAPMGGTPPKRDTIASSTTTDRWGTFALLERIGAGAAGEVWRAWDASLHRDVAVKFIHSPMAERGDPSQATLLDEARSLARVRHPGIVSVYGIAEFEGRPGIWMEFLRGPTLAVEIQDKGCLAWPDVARTGRDLCAALEALEEAGLVHCDIKPSNIIREPGGRVVLTDFGLGWRRRALTDSAARIGMGTPLFMAPSLLAGGAPTPRTDLYALGVTLRWALTGKSPFRAKNLNDLRTEVSRGPTTELSRQRPEAPASLVGAIERAMGVSSDTSSYTAAQMRADLERALEESGGNAATARAGVKPMGGWLRSRPLVVAVISTIVLAGVGWGLWTLTHGGFRTGSRAPLRKAALPPKLFDDSAGSLSPDGRLFAFALNGSAMVSAVEAGDIRVVAEATREGRTYHQAGWHPDGKRLLCIEADTSMNVAVSLIDLITGRHDVIARLGPLSADAILFASASISPDGRHLAVRKNFLAGSLRYRELWVKDLENGLERRLVQMPLGDGILAPAWSPDSRRLAYVVREESGGSRLETCSLQGARRTAVEEASGRLIPPSFDYGTLAWLPDRRLIYSWKYEQTASMASAELRTVRMDSRSGAASKSTLLYRHPGGVIVQSSVTRDGRKLAFALRQTKTRVRLLDLPTKAVRVALPALAVDEEMQSPVWSRDGRGVFLSINRAGNHDAYRLDLSSGRTEPILATKERDEPVCLTPDGLQVLCMRGRSLVAVPNSGGAERVLADSLAGTVLCPVGAGRECVVLVRVGSDLSVRGFDTTSGRMAERFRYAFGEPDPAVKVIAAISPDGERLVVFKSNHPLGVILDARSGRNLGRIGVRADAFPQSVSWSHNGRDLFLTGMEGYASYWLIRIKSNGAAEVLTLSEDEWMSLPSPSPDGQRLAFSGKRYMEDMWILDDP